MTSKPHLSVLITDLDNTLFDWFEPWYVSFSSLIRVLAEQSGLDKETLYSESQAVFQAHGTSEYAFLLQELPSLKAKHPDQDVVAIYRDAISAYDDARRETLRLYPDVMETLLEIRRSGTLIVGYTESMSFYSVRRVKNLELDGVLDFLFTQDEHDLPDGMDLDRIRKYPREAYELQRTVLQTTPRGKEKPSARILRFVVGEVGGTLANSAYVGDSLSKDILMAQDAGVIDVLAEYGQVHKREEYDLLKRVTHWTLEQVAREQELSKAKANPTFVLEHSFKELLDLFSFVAHGATTSDSSR